MNPVALFILIMLSYVGVAALFYAWGHAQGRRAELKEWFERKDKK